MKQRTRIFAHGFALIGTVALLAGLSGCAQKAAQTTDDADEQQVFIGDDIAIAQTQYGKVQGYILKGTYTFAGIPYGATTAGKNRFMPPQKPESWEGIRPAVFWGTSAPQNMANKYPNTYSTFADHWNYYNVGEDCLNLNVWTQGLDKKARPVLVWFHGGGFSSGNSIEQDGYMGANISKYGDIVAVSVNHRLNSFGFTDLSGVDPKFADSGNVGVLDLVASLQWVHENIANFGGDPNNVTVIGQSGGGSKVCTIVAMPETKGLVHKGVALSGSSTSATPQEASAELGKFILKEAGLKPSEVSKLQEMPWEEYYALANRASRAYNEQAAATGRRGGFSPVADGTHVPKGNFFASKDAPSAHVPMIFCTTTSEQAISRTNAELEKMDKAQAIAFLTQRMGRDATAAYEAYAKAFPTEKPVKLVNMIVSPRTRVIQAIDDKYQQGAPVYLAWFDWEPPLFDARMRAFHCIDICFWLHNTDLMLTHTGGGKRPRALSDKMSDALLSFMRTGDPNCASIPEWPAYTPEQGATMIWNDECKVQNDPDREARKALVN
ncbi:MAG: carboxylesterase family protein [Prevotellaceae bacterium]|jgi:para-nitrobenzyl esterase|nr:carboxylesterase family protein [Prevotellaceae bacterium]